MQSTSLIRETASQKTIIAPPPSFPKAGRQGTACDHRESIPYILSWRIVYPKVFDKHIMAATTMPDALLLLTSQCPFCPTVLQGLSELVKSGHVGRLEVVNIEKRPKIAASLGVRTVPWMRIGPFELDGLRSHAELKQWAERAGKPEGMKDYLSELFTTGGLKKVLELAARDPAYLDPLPLIVADTDSELHARLGVGAVMEELSGQPVLARLVEPLGALTRHDDARVRSDACHYLALSGDARGIPYVERCAEDPDATVREVAAESLATLRGVTGA
jgi:hypothetical protein